MGGKKLALQTATTVAFLNSGVQCHTEGRSTRSASIALCQAASMRTRWGEETSKTPAERLQPHDSTCPCALARLSHGHEGRRPLVLSHWHTGQCPDQAWWWRLEGGETPCMLSFSLKECKDTGVMCAYLLHVCSNAPWWFCAFWFFISSLPCEVAPRAASLLSDAVFSIVYLWPQNIFLQNFNKLFYWPTFSSVDALFSLKFWHVL